MEVGLMGSDMKEIEKIASKLEKKLSQLESDREKLSDAIRTKRHQIDLLEAAVTRLKNIAKHQARS